MQVFSNSKFMVIALTAFITSLGFLVFHRPPVNVQASTITPPIEASEYLLEAEQQHHQKLKLRTLNFQYADREKLKETSVECQFWRQQKSETSGLRIDEKIIQYCNM